MNLQMIMLKNYAAKTVDPQRLHTVLFHLHAILEVTNLEKWRDILPNLGKKTGLAYFSLSL